MEQIPDELQRYVSDSLAAGETREGIRDSLLGAGWGETLVNATLGFPEPPQAETDVRKKPHQKKKTGVRVIVIAVVAVAAAIVAAYLFWPSPKQPASAPPAGQANGGSATPPKEAAPTSTPAAYTGPLAATCADSNASLGSNAIYVKGTVTAVDSNGDAQTLVDYCADSIHLIEYVCYESPPGSGKYGSGRTIVKCANGCLNGACVR